MIIKRTIRTLAALGLLCLPVCGHTRPAINVRPGVAQLFIDDVMIDQESDLRRTLHQPVKDNDGSTPLVAARTGTTLLAYGSIVWDTRLKRYVMFVQEWPSRQMYRLTSADGLDWHPNTPDQLERVNLELSFPRLPAEAHGKPGMDLFSCYYDTTDAARPYKGWAWAANVGNEWEGIWYVYSADGLRWYKGRQIFSGYAGEGDPSCRVITQDGRTLYGPGDVTLFAHDPVENRFLGLFKFYSPHDLAFGSASRARAYAFLDGVDKPFDIFKGQDLVLNAVGPVKVEVLDESGKTRASAVVQADSVRQPVRFDSQSLRQVAPRRQCRLRFEVQPPGRLYSFTGW